MNLTNWWYVGKWLFIPKWHYFDNQQNSFDQEGKKISKLLPEQIYGMIYILTLTRKAKWYWLSDYIRNKLIGLGYNIQISFKSNKTTIQGFTWDKIGRMSLWYEI